MPDVFAKFAGAMIPAGGAVCPVCALPQALGTQTYSVPDTSSEIRFDYYQVLKNHSAT